MGRTRGYFNPVQRCSNEIRPAFKNSEVTNLLNPDCAFGIVACSFWFLLFLFLTLRGLRTGLVLGEFPECHARVERDRIYSGVAHELHLNPSSFIKLRD